MGAWGWGLGAWGLELGLGFVFEGFGLEVCTICYVLYAMQMKHVCISLVLADYLVVV